MYPKSKDRLCYNEQMYLRRCNPLNPRLVHSRLQSYYRNPSSGKRQKIEGMLESAIEAMNSVESAMSNSHKMIVSLFREFLDYTDAQDAPGAALDFVTLSEPFEPPPAEPPLVDPETGEPRFKLLRRAFSKNKALIEQLEYLSRKISQRREVMIIDAKAIMGIDDTPYVRRLLKRLIKQGLLKTKGQKSAMKYLWIGGPPRPDPFPPPPQPQPRPTEFITSSIVPDFEAEATIIEEQEEESLLPFKVLRFTPPNKVQVDAQLEYLLGKIMRAGEVKINDVKKIIELDNTVYARRLLERLIKDKFLRTVGKTKAKKYIWTQKRPEWAPPPPPRPRPDSSCPRCGKKMKKKGNFLRCPQRGCPGKRDLPSGVAKRPATRAPRIISQASVLAKVLNKTANNPTGSYLISELKAEFDITQTIDSLKKLLTKQPEIDIKGNTVTRKSSIAYKCTRITPYTSISYATKADGTQPARRGWQNLNKKARGHFTKLFERMCDHGKIEDGTKFKRLHGDIWEFKSNTHKRRITCFIEKNAIYLVHIFKKKEDKTPRQEVHFAERIRDEHQARERQRLAGELSREAPSKRLRRRNSSPFNSLYGPIYRRNPRQLHQRHYRRNTYSW